MSENAKKGLMNYINSFTYRTMDVYIPPFHWKVLNVIWEMEPEWVSFVNHNQIVKKALDLGIISQDY